MPQLVHAERSVYTARPAPLIGTENVRVAALTSGAIDATVTVLRSHLLLNQKGVNLLLLLADVADLPAKGFTTSDRTLREKRDQIKQLRRTMSRGRAFVKDRSKETVEIHGFDTDRDITMNPASLAMPSLF